MRDVYCPRCGEPWDVDMFHEAPGKSHREARSEFPSKGCEVFGATCSEIEGDERSRMRAMLAGAAMDMSPHVDDWAADLADIEMFL